MIDAMSTMTLPLMPVSVLAMTSRFVAAIVRTPRMSSATRTSRENEPALNRAMAATIAAVATSPVAAASRSFVAVCTLRNIRVANWVEEAGPRYLYVISAI